MTDLGGTTAVVDVQSAWFSKINWAQAIGIVTTMLAIVTSNKVQVPTEIQVAIVTAIQAATSVATWLLKTFFTTTITPSSAAKK